MKLATMLIFGVIVVASAAQLTPDVIRTVEDSFFFMGFSCGRLNEAGGSTPRCEEMIKRSRAIRK